jgi:hypothetical protein
MKGPGFGELEIVSMYVGTGIGIAGLIVLLFSRGTLREFRAHSLRSFSVYLRACSKGLHRKLGLGLWTWHANKTRGEGYKGQRSGLKLLIPKE